MNPFFAFPLVVLLALGGCAEFVHHPGDSFAHTEALANAGQADAQLDLARMYADPAAWPQTRGRPPDPVKAAKWCIIVQTKGLEAPSPAALARGPSCEQIMATLPPSAVFLGNGLATGWLMPRPEDRLY
jgi:hypothetical protein